MQMVFVGRQPIYTATLEVHGYELLFRSGEIVNRADFEDGDKATSQVILNTFVEIGLNNIVGDRPAFVNLTENLLVQGFPYQLPKDRIVLEILEDVRVNEKVIKAVKDLCEAGYTIALDDFIFRAELEPLIAFAHLIKVDLMSMDRTSLADHAKLLKSRNVLLVAEKVETQDEFSLCKSLGFNYFQGFFFAKPTIVKGQKMPASRLAILRLLAQLQHPNSTVTEMEEVISMDVSLSYKLLRIINSALYGMMNKVKSIPHALVLLGHQRIKQWAMLIMLEGVTDKPDELLVTAMVRAKMCEILGGALRQERDKESYFTVGLFSALDAVLNMPMNEVVASLPLSDEVSDALLEKKGLMGKALACVLAYEKGDWNTVISSVTLDEHIIGKAYLEAVRWAMDSQRAMQQQQY